MTWENCESCARETKLLYRLVDASDELVAKALVASEVARIAKHELRLRQLLLRAWNLRSGQAAAVAREVRLRGQGSRDIMVAVNKVMARFAEDVGGPYTSGLESVYRLARQAGVDKSNDPFLPSLQFSLAQLDQLGKPISPVQKVRRRKPKVKVVYSFDVFDRSAVDALADDQMMWVGNFYSSQLRETISRAVREIVSVGGSRFEEAAAVQAALEERFGKINIPRGFRGSADDYFQLIAANAVTVARSRGQIRSFQDAGISTYILVNPDDHRTTDICRWLNGKEFLTEDAIAQIERQAGATTPEEYKRAAPWMSFAQLKEISTGSGFQPGTADSRALVDAGYPVLPPFHGKCRTTTDIAGTPVLTGVIPPAAQRMAGTGGMGPKRVRRPEPNGNNTGRRDPQAKPRNRGPVSDLPATLPYEFGLWLIPVDDEEEEPTGT